MAKHNLIKNLICAKGWADQQSDFFVCQRRKRIYTRKIKTKQWQAKNQKRWKVLIFKYLFFENTFNWTVRQQINKNKNSCFLSYLFLWSPILGTYKLARSWETWAIHFSVNLLTIIALFLAGA